MLMWKKWNLWEKLRQETMKVYEEETAKDPHWNDLDLEQVQRNRLIMFVLLYFLVMVVAKKCTLI